MIKSNRKKISNGKHMSNLEVNGNIKRTWRESSRASSCTSSSTPSLSRNALIPSSPSIFLFLSQTLFFSSKSFLLSPILDLFSAYTLSHLLSIFRTSPISTTTMARWWCVLGHASHACGSFGNRPSLQKNKNVQLLRAGSMRGLQICPSSIEFTSVRKYEH